MPANPYNKAYFDTWYRNPDKRVSTPALLAKKVRLAVAVSEYYLGRRIRNVLDVGCGEGQWRQALKKIRPRLHYTGVDPSPYVLQKFGKRRNVISGSFGHLPKLARAYDLIICSDCLYYVPDEELIIGLDILARHLAGVAFLEAYPSEEEVEGDTAMIHPRSAAHYRRLFKKSGFLSCGSHCYVGPALRDLVTELEKGH
jgi:SAM-dependent methyltransferase